MKTAVVILNWNTEDFLRKFLPGLVRSCAKVEGAEVVVADNASTDGSLKLMAEEFPHVRTLKFEKKFLAWQQAIEEALNR
jgi:GT2 family glycosyltransferase